MRSWSALPDVPLSRRDRITAAFRERGAVSVQQAGRLLQSLPYGRNTDGGRPLAVLEESRGTCSTKHALLARLAEEQELPIYLTLGIYEMSEANTPGVGAVLERFDLAFVIEAHCYLVFDGARIDVTRVLDSASQPIERFLHEERITPDQIGSHKQQLHRRMLGEWIDSNPDVARGHDVDRLWNIREACIAALGQ
jgi:hypothetical protein